MKKIEGNILINKIARKDREKFKRKFKPYLKSKGVSIHQFDRLVILKAMKDPKAFV